MQKQEQYKNLFKFGLNLIIWIIQVGIWAFFWMREYNETLSRPFGPRGYWLIFAVYGIIAFFFSSLYGGYHIGYSRRDDVILSNFIAVVFTNGITYLQTCIIGISIMTVSPFVYMTLIDFVVFSLWAMLSFKLYGKLFPPHKMLLIYGGDVLATNLAQKMSSRYEKYCIQEAVSVETDNDEILEKMLTYPSVILCDVPAAMRNRLIKLCFEKDIRVYTTPKISDILIRSAEDITLFDTPILLNRNCGMSLEQKFLKRLIDIVFAAIMLIVSSPLMIITAIAIKAYDRGPVIFKQARATMNGRTFYVYKFRSMIVDAEKDGKSRPAVDNDRRITPVGKIIRATRLDELPQFWNILIGDMSVVGPRPERLEHVEKYTAEVPEFIYRLKVRAGLTGYAQVIGKYNTTAYDKLKMDLMYIAGYSLILDLKIMLLTFKILFKTESTEGM